MFIASQILKANHIGVREFKDRFSELLSQDEPLVITNRGTPTHVVLPYEKAMDLIESIESTKMGA